jgi:TatD DNase family protein
VLIDVHTHTKLASKSITTIENICVASTSSATSSVVISEDQQFFSVGVHPWSIVQDQDSEKQIRTYSERLYQAILGVREADVSHRIVAIGETGLDKHISTSLELQKHMFEIHVVLAEEVQKPIIIHCVRSFGEVLQIRKRLHSTVPWIFHGFNRNYTIARQIIEAGCYCSFGDVLFSEHSPHRSVITQLWDEFPKRIFLETDDGKHGDIENVYRQAHLVLKRPKKEIIHQLEANFFEVFQIP